MINTKPKPRKQNPQNLRSVAKRLYQRNMQMLNDYKGTHPCLSCGQSFPAPMMHFVGQHNGQTLSQLAGSRCSAEILIDAMVATPLYCAAHRPKIKRNRK